MIEIEFSPSAKLDYAESVEWYRAQDRDAAYQFEAAIESVLGKIVRDPYRFAPYDDVHHYLLVPKYPFQVIFEVIDDSKVFIVAFAHASRRPDYWKRK